ncbi:MAG: HAMP domain-containing histidine kinase [Candidatus Carbobacillus altaicus]|nr:HAMP domain-containing histidine kinase [Candidatus Carbobacillus altaicus]
MNALIRTRIRLAIFFGVMVGLIVLLTLLVVYASFNRMIWQHETGELNKLAQAWIESNHLDISTHPDSNTPLDVYFMTEPSAYGVLRHHFYIVLKRPSPVSGVPPPLSPSFSNTSDLSLPKTKVTHHVQADATWIVTHMQEALEKEEWYTLKWLVFPDQKNVQATYAAMLIPFQDLYVLLVGEDVSDYHMLLDQLKHRLTLSALILLALSALIGYVFSARAIRPLLDAHEKERAFLANASHELRTPLTVIGTSLEVMEELKDTWPDFYQEVFGDLKREVKRTQSIVRMLFELSRLEQNPELPMKPVDLLELVQSAYRTFKPIAEAQHTSLRFMTPTEENGSFVIQGNETTLYQLVVNLLDNALKFTPSGRSVVLHLKRETNHVLFCVEDEGRGMDDETKKHIFERFYRANAQRDPTSGAGLGMALVKMIADSHHARIDIESAPGQGTTVCVMFPIA